MLFQPITLDLKAEEPWGLPGSCTGADMQVWEMVGNFIVKTVVSDSFSLVCQCHRVLKSN